MSRSFKFLGLALVAVALSGCPNYKCQAVCNVNGVEMGGGEYDIPALNEEAASQYCAQDDKKGADMCDTGTFAKACSCYLANVKQ